MPQTVTITPNQHQALELAIAALKALKNRQASLIIDRTIDGLNLILESSENA
jgi:hypothetical protein